MVGGAAAVLGPTCSCDITHVGRRRGRREVLVQPVVLLTARTGALRPPLRHVRTGPGPPQVGAVGLLHAGGSTQGMGMGGAGRSGGGEVREGEKGEGGEERDLTFSPSPTLAGDTLDQAKFMVMVCPRTCIHTHLHSHTH